MSYTVAVIEFFRPLETVVARVFQKRREIIPAPTYPEVSEVVIRPDLLEKSKQIAHDLANRGARAVILYGSAARGRGDPNDLDFLVFGDVDGNRRELEEELESEHGIKIQLIIFSEVYVESLISAYKGHREKGSLDLLVFGLMFERMDPGREHAASPLIPLLSEREFQDFFGKPAWGFSFQKEYLILNGINYVDAKRKETSLDTLVYRVYTDRYGDSYSGNQGQK